jgi:hypothetical protein
LVFAECPERFAIPEILEGTMGKIEIIAAIVLWGFGVFFVIRYSRRARRFAI